MTAADPPRRTTKRRATQHAATLLPDGQEICLACGQPWPCENAPRSFAVPVTPPQPGPEEVLAVATSSRVPWQIVADRYGVDRAEVQALIDSSMK